MARSIPISAFGVDYPSIREAAAAFNLPESTLRRRLAQVHPVETEVALVCTAPIRVEFAGLDGKAYHPVKWSDCEYATARQIVQHYRPDLVAAYDAVNPTGQYKPYKPHTKGGDK